MRNAREFTRRRKIAPGETTMKRLYVIESTPTITGAMADHRFPMRSSDITQAITDKQPPWITRIFEDLERHRGRSIVIAGDGQPPEVHALVHGMNQRFGNVGQTVFYTE